MSLPVLDETPVVYNRGFSFYTLSSFRVRFALPQHVFLHPAMMQSRARFCFLPLLVWACCLGVGLQPLAAQPNNRIPKKDTTSIPIDSAKYFRFQEAFFVAGGQVAELYPIVVRLDAFQLTGYRNTGLGNLGSPGRMLELPASPAEAFRRAQSSFDFFGYSDANRMYYTSKRPFTSIRYVVGQRRASETEVIHAHNFGPNLNISFGFLRQRAEGFYNRQATNNTSVRLNGWYWSKTNRYGLTADFYWTGHNAQENGGIRLLSSFENATQLDRRLVAVNLLEADNRQRVRSGRVRQYWAFGTVIDTLVIRGDSLDDRDTLQLKPIIRPRVALVHTLQFRDESYRYRDANPEDGFYNTIYRDSTATLDSTGVWRLHQALALELFPSWRGQNAPISGTVGLKHELGRLRNDTIRHDFQNLYAEGLFRIADPKTNFLRKLELEAWYVVAGENAGDHRAALTAADKTIFRKPLVAEAILEWSRTQPVYLSRHFSGNHFRWINDFSQEDIFRVGASLLLGTKKFSWIKLGADLFNYNRPVYFDTTQLPAQWNGAVSIFRLELSHLLHTRVFHWRGSVQWHQLPSASPIRLPALIARQSFWVQFRFFKRAMQFQAGIDAEWFSGYFANAYNPNLAQFYLQNTQEIGNYLYFDPWVSIRIKPVRVFIKADHVNAGLFGRKYYLAPRYPHNDFALRLGISWVFND